MKERAATLATYLWDLRAQMEAQLRTLTAAQQVLDRVTGGQVSSDESTRAQVEAQLRDMRRAGLHIADVIDEALTFAAAPGPLGPPGELEQT